MCHGFLSQDIFVISTSHCVKTFFSVMLFLTLFLHSLLLPGRLPLLLVDLGVGVTQFDLGVVCQAGRNNIQLQVFIVLHKGTYIYLLINNLKQKYGVKGKKLQCNECVPQS